MPCVPFAYRFSLFLSCAGHIWLGNGMGHPRGVGKLTRTLTREDTVAIKSIRHLVWPVTCLTKLWFRQIAIFGNYDGDL